MQSSLYCWGMASLSKLVAMYSLWCYKLFNAIVVLVELKSS